MKRVNLLMSLLVAGVVSVVMIASKTEAAKRPNVLLIITDDQAPFTLKAHGNEVCETPNIDRLATSAKHSPSNSSVCFLGGT